MIEITKMYMDGSGDYLYALLSFGGEKHAIHVFRRDPYSGDLVKQQSFLDEYPTSGLKGIYEMDFTNDNRFIYATSARDYHVNIFENTKAAGSVVLKPEVTEMGITDDGFEWEEADQPGTGTYTYEKSKPVNEMNYERPVETIVNHTTGVSLGEIQFNEIWEKLKNESSDTKRFDLCYELLEGKSLKTVQIASVAMLFSSEYKRLEFVKFTLYFVKDKENFKLLADLFTYDRIKQDFYKLPL